MTLAVVGVVALTLPRVRVISNTKWELNMTRKYHVASSAMVSRILGVLRFDTFDFAAKKVINENARRSGVHIAVRVSRNKHNQVRVQGNHDAPYKSSVLVYAISRALCRETIHRRYASRGIGGSD